VIAGLLGHLHRLFLGLAGETLRLVFRLLDRALVLLALVLLARLVACLITQAGAGPVQIRAAERGAAGAAVKIFRGAGRPGNSGDASGGSGVGGRQIRGVLHGGSGRASTTADISTLRHRDLSFRSLLLRRALLQAVGRSTGPL
jgi:hypothetical protein